MSGAKHTPGPWSVFKAAHTIQIDKGAKPKGKRPCIVEWGGFDCNDMPRATNLANAHLIAAAPMLLDACEDALKALRLLRVGMAKDVKAVEMIDAHISEIEYAMLAARGEA